MADHNYTFLDIITLDAGSWADWVSGSASFSAVAVSLMGYWMVSRQRSTDERARERRVAEAIEWKLLQAFNDMGTIALHLKEGLSRSVEFGFPGAKFDRVQPLGLPPERVADISSEEVSFLLKAKASDILMKLSIVIKRYDSIRVAMNEYSTRHKALYELLPTPVSMSGVRATHSLSSEEMKKVEPYAKMLDALIDGMVDLVADSVNDCDEMFSSFENMMKKYFGKWHVKIEKVDESVDLTVFRSTPLR